MRRANRASSRIVHVCGAFVILLFYALVLQAQLASSRKSDSETNAQKAARYFESIRKSPPQMLAFLLAMPKGGDLHNHLSGAIYAESYIQWASDSGLCINTTTMALLPAPATGCDPKSGQPTASTALANSTLYGQMIDAWSMRNWQLSGQSGHD